MQQTRQIPQLHYKYLIVGDSGVGKTSLLLKYTSSELQQKQSSEAVGIDNRQKNIYCPDFRAWLNIWDTAGQQKFNSITKSCYKGRHGILLAYSVTDPLSFNHIDSWIAQIKNNCSEDTKIVLLGCKCDLDKQRRITRQQGQQMGKKYKIRFFEVSSFTNRNLYLSFFTLTKQIFQQQEMRKARQKEQQLGNPRLTLKAPAIL